MKKILILGGVALMLVSQITLAQFSDVPKLHPYKEAIQYYKDLGILNGYADGTFKPNAHINRAEFTKIVMMVKQGSIYTFPDGKDCFADVKVHDWFSPYVCLAKDIQVVDGYGDGTFMPNDKINVAESLKITFDAWGLNLYDENQIWYMPYVNYAKFKDIWLMSWKSEDQFVTRSEMAELEFRVTNLFVEALTDAYMETQYNQ